MSVEHRASHRGSTRIFISSIALRTNTIAACIYAVMLYSTLLGRGLSTKTINIGFYCCPVRRTHTQGLSTRTMRVSCALSPQRGHLPPTSHGRSASVHP